MGRSRKKLVDEKELLNKNMIISNKLMIFLKTEEFENDFGD